MKENLNEKYWKILQISINGRRSVCVIRCKCDWFEYMNWGIRLNQSHLIVSYIQNNHKQHIRPPCKYNAWQVHVIFFVPWNKNLWLCIKKNKTKKKQATKWVICMGRSKIFIETINWCIRNIQINFNITRKTNTNKRIQIHQNKCKMNHTNYYK